MSVFKQFFYSLIALVISLPAIASVDGVLHQAQQKFYAPAIAASVSYPNGQITDYTVGYQTVAKQHRIKPHMYFQVASITKTFTAALMLKLQTEHKLNLNDTLGKYLPQYPKWKNITLRQLLNQTTGIYDYIDIPMWFPMIAKTPNKVWTLPAIIQYAYHHTPSFLPGTGWQYSNSNYVLAGMVIKKVTGKSIRTLMNQMLFKPYGLHHTRYIISAFPPKTKKQLVHGYYFDRHNMPHDITFDNTSWLGSAGGISSNPHDVTIWASKIFRGQVFTPNEFKQVTQTVSPFTGKPQPNLSKPGYGLGFFRMNTPFGLIWFTPGLSSGYRTMLSYMPCTNIAITYSMSTSDMYHNGSAKFLLTNLYQTILAKPKTQKLIRQYFATHPKPKYCRTLLPAKRFIHLGTFFKHK